MFFINSAGTRLPLSPLATPNTAASGAIGNFSTPPVTVDPFGLLVFGMFRRLDRKEDRVSVERVRVHALNNLLVVAIFGARDDRLSGVRYTLSRLRSTGKESKHGGAAR